MKKVLILAHDLPPYNSVGASRPYSWLIHLSSKGIYPVIVTRYWDNDIKDEAGFVSSSSIQQVVVETTENGILIRVPYKSNFRDRLLIKYGHGKFVMIRKLLSVILHFLKFVTFFLDSTSGIYFEARKYIRESGCDVIIATGQPFCLFRYASKLSREFSIPWIADYRDGWSTNLKLVSSGTFSSKMIIRFYRFFEKRYLRSVSTITMASHTFAPGILALCKGKEAVTVYNGYEDGLLKGLEFPPQNDKEFEIAYAGRLYPHQPVELFMEGLRQFLKRNSAANIKLVFYGTGFIKQEEDRLLRAAGDLVQHLQIMPRVPYPEYMLSLARANLLLLLTSKKVEWGTTKIYDYFVINRKILMVENDQGLLKNMILNCGGGLICDNSEEVSAALEEAYNEFLKKKCVPHASVNFQKYSRSYQTGILAEIIKKCAE